MTRAVVESVEIPVVASGGAGKPEHLRAVLAEAGASAALAASIFHYQHYSIRETKDYLASWGVPVRITDLARPAAVPGAVLWTVQDSGRYTAAVEECISMATVVEAPVDAMPNEPEANKLFRMVMRFKGSDLHLKVGMAPAMRLAGVLRLMQLPPLTGAEMERLMFPLLSNRQKTILEDTGGVDFLGTSFLSHNGDETRFRVNLFKQARASSASGRSPPREHLDSRLRRTGAAAGHGRDRQPRSGDRDPGRCHRLGEVDEHRRDASVRQHAGALSHRHD